MIQSNSYHRSFFFLQSITKLVLSRNQISDQGAKYLSDGLKMNQVSPDPVFNLFGATE